MHSWNRVSHVRRGVPKKQETKKPRNLVMLAILLGFVLDGSPVSPEAEIQTDKERIFHPVEKHIGR
jgi:hypothetical protein